VVLSKQEELEVVRVEVDGSSFSAYFHKLERFYFCPVCGLGEDSPIFFKQVDLLAHMAAHVKQKRATEQSRFEKLSG